MIWNTIGTLFLAIFALTAHTEEFVLPPNDGFITDPGDVISLMEEEKLEQKMAEERKQTGLSFVSVILPALAGRDLAHLAWELRTKWGLEQNGSGVLLLIAREEGKILIAPSQRHEQILTDTVLVEIIETDILPMLHRGQYALAIEQGTDTIREHLHGKNTEKPQESGLPAKNVGISPIVIFLLVLLACFTWARKRSKKTGSSRRRRQ